MSREVKEEKLKKFANPIINDFGKEDLFVDYQVIQGFAADEIIEASSALENSMIVMGSTGNSKIQKKLFGSVSIKVAKSSQRPVLLIPYDLKFKPWNNILYCSNDLNLDTAVFNKLVDHAKIFNSDIHLIHANTDSSPNYSELNLIKLYQNFYSKDKIHFSQLDCESPIEAIQNYSEEHDIDIIASATQDRGFVNELFHKSFTKELALKANLPLLIYHK